MSKESPQSQAEHSSESYDAETVKRYKESFLFAPEDLRNKRILDLGCDSGDFINFLLSEDITSAAYGMDKRPPTQDEFVDHFSQGDFRESIPYTDMDVVVSLAALSLSLHEDVESTYTAFKNALDSLTNGGELKVFPIFKDSGKEWEGIVDEERNLLIILEKLEKEYDIETKTILVETETDQNGKPDYEKHLLLVKKIGKKQKE
ncbi:MAG: hypothetical protein H8D63_00950 [Parcubacteria group bacterium]|nr:hypothetical protein [Parcubacteria group bacterium]